MTDSSGSSTSHPRTGLERVLDDLGGTLLHLAHGRIAGERGAAGIGGVVIHDPVEDSRLPDNALVLAVGVADPAGLIALLREVADQGAVGLVVRAPVPVTTEVATAAEETGVALLGLARGATWAQLAAMLRTLLAEGDVGPAEAESLGGFPSGDLFALANAVAALLDAPITIEDRGSRVLAFSGRQDETDSGRVETVLGRQVPQRYLRVLVERGVFRDLHRSDEPVFVGPIPGEQGGSTLPRVAVSVRAGDEILGSIWAAVKESLSDERLSALREAAKLVALHMLRARAGADVERRLRADLVGTALEGGPEARDALRRLGLADQPVVVLGLSVVGPAEDSVEGDASLVGEQQRLSDAFSMHLSACHPRSATALVADTTYGLVPVNRGEGHQDERAEERALAIGTDFLDRLGENVHAVVGIGPVGQDVAELALSRRAADRVLRVLREGSRTKRAARLGDVHVESLLIDLRNLVHARGDQPIGPVTRLTAYDRAHHTRLLETLGAWLDAFGDVIAASEAVHVHPNTFRYRLRRLSEVGEIDLTDPDARLGVMMQLRVM